MRPRTWRPGRVTGQDARVLDPGARAAGPHGRRGGAVRADSSCGRRPAGSKQTAIVTADRDEQARHAALRSIELQGREEAVVELHREVDRINREAAGIIEQLHERERAVVDLRERLEEADRANEQLRHDIAAANKRAEESERFREQARELQQRLDATESRRRRAPPALAADRGGLGGRDARLRAAAPRRATWRRSRWPSRSTARAMTPPATRSGR